MTTNTMAETHTGHAEEHHNPGFIKTYLFSTDHKMIARQFLFSALFFLLVGGILAGMVRWQLGFPGQPMPGGSSCRTPWLQVESFCRSSIIPW